MPVGSSNNIFLRFGAWLESRRKASQKDYLALLARVEKLESTSPLMRQVASLQNKVDQVELFVGLKRQRPQTQPGDARVA